MSIHLYYCFGPLPKAPKPFLLLTHEAAKQTPSYTNSRNWIKWLMQQHNFDLTSFHYSNRGKPQLSSPHQYLSITHSRDLWICAIANIPIGIDCETKPPSAPETYAQSFHLNTTDPQALSWDWMQREAWAKLTDKSIFSSRKLPASTLLQTQSLHAKKVLVSDQIVCVATTDAAVQIITHDLQETF